jgi:ATP-binding cassette subfamily F protein uup
MAGIVSPDSGSVEKGDTVVFGYYKQLGEVFDDDMTVLDAVKKIAEEVTLSDGKILSVTQFLTFFLFPPEKQNIFIRKLSGGEKRRLYLLSVLMRNPNFLILDEPTNDLDILTLNVLEEYLAGFRGCVVVVSHDRYFMDKVVDHIFENRGNGIIRDFPGNYSVFREKQLEEQRIMADVKPERQANTVKKAKENGEKSKKQGLTFREKLELDDLAAEISRLEAEKTALESEMNSGLLTGDEIFKRSRRYGEIMKQLDDKEIRWFELSEKM